jgi:tetratricopeptide (TPR) repeat protein
MNNHHRGWKQRLAAVSRLWDREDYDTALAEVDSMLSAWPGNAHLHVLRASLLQLQESPKVDLEEVKRALQVAVDLDKGAPAAVIELGHYFDNVEDDPQAAAKAFAQGVTNARQLLMEALLGQAKAYRQLGKKEDFLRCLLEVLHLARFDAGTMRSKADQPGADVIFESPTGRFNVVQLKGPYADQIRELLGEWTASKSA